MHETKTKIVQTDIFSGLAGRPKEKRFGETEKKSRYVEDSVLYYRSERGKKDTVNREYDR